MFKKIKRLFCKHDYKYQFKLAGVEQNIWKCKKCGQGYLQGYGLGIGYKIKDSEMSRTKRFFRRDNI